MGNYFKYNTGGAVFLLLAFICVTAMPPSGLFISEFLIFRSLFEAQYLYILIPVLILLTIIIWSFGKNVFKILFTPPVNFDESTTTKASQIELFSQYFLLSLVIYLGLNPPSGFVKLIQEAVSNLM
jgi:hydrogenase-4 component F